MITKTKKTLEIQNKLIERKLGKLKKKFLKTGMFVNSKGNIYVHTYVNYPKI